jgi:hypothetical protein
LAEAPAQRDSILLKAGEGGSPLGVLEAARLLRDAGHIVAFDLGYKDVTPFRWIVDMSSGRKCALTDQASGKRVSAAPSELLRLIEARS